MQDTPQTWISLLSGGGGKCLTVNNLNNHFQKSPYEISVPNRKDNQLFPISAIKEYRSPSIIFENSSYTLDDTVSTITNPFSGMNVQYLTVKTSDSKVISSTTIENSNSDTLTDGTLQTTGNIICQIVKNTSTGMTKTASVTMSGFRTDYGGTISNSFHIFLEKAKTYAVITGIDIPINIPYNDSLEVFLNSNTAWNAQLTTGSNFSFSSSSNTYNKSGGGNTYFYIYNTGGAYNASNRSTLIINFENNDGTSNFNSYPVKLRNT